MAEKETNTSKATGKTTVKATSKPAAAAAPKTTAAAKPASKPATTAVPKTTVKAAATSSPKDTATAKPAPKPAATKPAAVEATPKVAAARVDEAEAKPEKAKKEKPAKAAKTPGGGGSKFKAQVAAIVRTDNFKIFGIIGLSLLLVLCLSLGLVFGLQSCVGMEGILKRDPVTVNAYANTTKVGYSYQNVGTVQRYKPVEGVHNEQDAFPLPEGVNPSKRYPTYGSTPTGITGVEEDKVNARNAIISESSYLCAWGTAGANRGGEATPDKYTWMDKDGWLYRGTRTEPVKSLVKTSTGYGTQQRQLYKHTASVGLYLGDVSDDEPGIVKQVTLRPRGYSSYSVTGVYAPAGEVVKIQISGADMNATGGISVHIGQALYNGQANNIWAGKNTMPRMPHILNTLVINKETATYDEATDTWTGYVGSFLGGPVYIRNTNTEINVTISGACAYRHFILGYTTEAEFKELSKSTVPYFDLEVWEYGVLHSGPVRYAQSFSYNDLYKAAVLWEKVSTVTTTNGTKQGIVFLYDPFVAAGAAVAFPGRSSVNCPLGWMSQSLNYNSIVTSGSWGNFHEYHHNFQNYGVGYTGEVTNNGLNLVSYSLFTKISSSRQIAGYGGSGLSGWNRYTSATWALNQVNNGSIASTNGLAVYATLLHNLGQDAFIQARGASGVNYLNKWANVTHQDFSYFDSQITAYTGGKLNPAATEYPLFVPVSSVYQTGRTYTYDGEKREITTMQPYVIPAEKPFKVDLNAYNVNDAGQYASGSVVIGRGFTYKIKGVKTHGINGTFVKSGDGEGIYTFTPNSELRSGKIYVTLEIYNEADGTREWNGHKLDDVDLILEFQQSYESNKNVLQRTIYKFDEMKYTSATEAYAAGYAGNTGSETVDNKNYSQNSNTDIWLYPSRYTDDPTYGQYVYIPNSVLELKGKLYFPETGTYRIYMRGRSDCALYISRDSGKTYSLAAHIDRNDNLGTSAVFFPNNSKTYIDVSVQAEEWIYFKEVLIVEPMPGSNNMVSYVGLGLGTWTVPEYTTEVKYYIEKDGNKTYVNQETVDDEILYYYTSGGNKNYVDENNVRSETHYYTNRNGKKVEVTAEEASNVDPVAPTSATYATAYRQSYEFQKQFESDYFYIRSYDYDYKDNVSAPKNEVTVTKTNYTATGWGAGMPITNVTDGKNNTYIHTSWQVTVNKPLELTFDLGGERTINRISFYCRNNNGMLETPKAFTVEGSLDGETWFNVAEYTDAPRNGHNVTVDFDDATMRYCRIKISQTHQGNGSYYVVIGEITFTHSTEILGGTQYSPDDKMFTYKGEWKTQSCHANFGHVYIGKNATMEFEFDGTRLGIFASKFYGKNYEVHIDGKIVESATVKEDNGDYSLVYLSPELQNGKHQVVIYCHEEGNIDSIVVW